MRLLRGAGVLGLASMRAVRRFGKGLHARTVAEVFTGNNCWHTPGFMAWTGLKILPTPTPTWTGNYLRHKVVPAIKDRWPSVALPVSRTIDTLTETQELLDEMARQDLLICSADDPCMLIVERVKRLPAARQKNMLRYWCRILDLPTPDSRR